MFVGAVLLLRFYGLLASSARWCEFDWPIGATGWPMARPWPYNANKMDIDELKNERALARCPIWAITGARVLLTPSNSHLISDKGTMGSDVCVSSEKLNTIYWQ